MLIGASVGMLCAFAASAFFHDVQDKLQTDSSRITCCVRLSSDETKSVYGNSAYGTIIGGLHKGLQVRMFFSGSKAQTTKDLLLCGQLIEVTANLSLPNDNARENCWRRGVLAYLDISDYDLCDERTLRAGLEDIRKAAISGILEAKDSSLKLPFLSEDDFYVLTALVCGYRGELSDSKIYESYKADGLAHLIAVSGAHLSIVSSIVANFLTALRVPKRFAALLQIAFILAYLVLAGLPISGIRAAIMACCSFSAFYAKRRPASCNALGLCIIAIVALQPYSATSVSFILSAGSTLGIILFSRYFSTLLQLLFPRCPKVFVDPLALTIAAGIPTQAYSATLFAKLPLVSPLANIATCGLFACSCTVGVTCTLLSIVSGPLGIPLLNVAGALIGFLDVVVTAISRFPFSSVPFSGNPVLALVLSAGLSFALWKLWPFPRRKNTVRSARTYATVGGVIVSFALFLALFLPYASEADYDEICALDVGQGDAILIRSKGETMLVDTGNEDGLLRAALARNGVSALKAVAISHADDDHCGSLPVLKSTAHPEALFVSLPALSNKEQSYRNLLQEGSIVVGSRNICGLSPGDVIECGAFSLEAIWPERFTCEGGNGDSLTFLVRYDGDGDGNVDATALLCGDAESEQLEQMIGKGRVGHVDILKVGHHGSKVSLSETALNVLSPKIALISVGENNTYGHPSGTTISLLKSASCAYYRTDEDGDIRCKLTAHSIRIETMG